MKVMHLLLLTSVTLVLMYGLSSFFLIDATQDTLKESVGNKAISLARQLGNEVDQTIHIRIEEFEMYSKDLVLQELVLAARTSS